MNVSRRDFLKFLGCSALIGSTGCIVPPSSEIEKQDLRIKGADVTTTICPYCAVGCGMIVYTKGKKVVNIEGDTEHPINEGSLCSKGNALIQVINNERRLDRVFYRAPGGGRWEEKPWDWALKQIAMKVKETRDTTFLETDSGKKVNKTEGIACLGGAALDNEECYLLVKLMRALGITFIEHQARI